MADKKGKTTKNAGQFAEVLPDAENNFVISLEKLVLKKSANNAVFKDIKNTSETKMGSETFKQ